MQNKQNNVESKETLFSVFGYHIIVSFHTTKRLSFYSSQLNICLVGEICEE